MKPISGSAIKEAEFHMHCSTAIILDYSTVVFEKLSVGRVEQTILWSPACPTNCYGSLVSIMAQ